MTDRATLNDKLEAYLKARPLTWIDGKDLEQVAGRYGWRTRVSNLRRHRGMTIENRQRCVRLTTANYTVSEYRYMPEYVGDVQEATPSLSSHVERANPEPFSVPEGSLF
jgi:hypothetical protein